jgi:Protein of unknown function (DUF2716)
VWEEIDYESVWTPFDALYGFRPGISVSPAIREPRGSITYDVPPCWNDSGAAGWARETVNFAVVWAPAEIVGPDSPLIVLDWQHPAHRFWPYRSPTISAAEMLGWVTPIPNGDYYAFLTEDLCTGTFGHPWEPSPCVFGDLLVERLHPILDAVLPRLKTNL